jgi:uncharacterized protein (DUF433 family)
MSAPAILDEWVDEEPEVFDRITSRPEMLGGKPCIAGSRISVQFILERIAGGESIDTFVRTYPHLDPADVKQAVLFAASHMSAAAFSNRVHGE